MQTLLSIARPKWTLDHFPTRGIGRLICAVNQVTASPSTSLWANHTQLAFFDYSSGRFEGSRAERQREKERGKTMQDKAMQGKARQGKARHLYEWRQSRQHPCRPGVAARQIRNDAPPPRLCRSQGVPGRHTHSLAQPDCPAARTGSGAPIKLLSPLSLLSLSH